MKIQITDTHNGSIYGSVEYYDTTNLDTVIARMDEILVSGGYYDCTDPDVITLYRPTRQYTTQSNERPDTQSDRLEIRLTDNTLNIDITIYPNVHRDTPVMTCHLSITKDEWTAITDTYTYIPTVVSRVIEESFVSLTSCAVLLNSVDFKRKIKILHDISVFNREWMYNLDNGNGVSYSYLADAVVEIENSYTDGSLVLTIPRDRLAFITFESSTDEFIYSHQDIDDILGYSTNVSGILSMIVKWRGLHAAFEEHCDSLSSVYD